MAYRLPSFPLVCDIYRTPGLAGHGIHVGFPDVVSDCQLRVHWGGSLSPVGLPLAYGHYRELYLPALTDIRPYNGGNISNTYHGDVVEIPSGSGRWYAASDVDDVAKGFPNEYRVAVVQPIHPVAYDGVTTLYWPMPIP